MSVAQQKRLAIIGAVLLVAVFIAANVHLITVAMQSQSRCIAPAPDKAPAKLAC